MVCATLVLFVVVPVVHARDCAHWGCDAEDTADEVALIQRAGAVRAAHGRGARAERSLGGATQDKAALCSAACRKTHFVEGKGYSPVMFEAESPTLKPWEIVSRRTFRDMADFVIDWEWKRYHHSEPAAMGQQASWEAALACLPPVPIVYQKYCGLEGMDCRVHYPNSTVANFSRKLGRPFILITGDSDMFVSKQSTDEYFQDPNVKAWFGEGSRELPSVGGRMQRLPLGAEIGGVRSLALVHSEVRAAKSQSADEWERRPGFLFVCFSSYDFGPSKDVRPPLLQRLCEGKDPVPWVTCCKGPHAPARFQQTGKMNQTTFFREVAQHRFVLSPMGCQDDSFRFYEALYLDTIPVVSSDKHVAQTLNELYAKRYPAAIALDSWDQLSPEILEERGKAARSQPGGAETYHLPSLWRDYWFQLIEGARTAVLQQETGGGGATGDRWRCWGGHCGSLQPEEDPEGLCKPRGASLLKWG